MNKNCFRANFRKESNRKELLFTIADVEKFWSRIAEKKYEQANIKLHKSHVQRFDISIHRLNLPQNGKLLNLWSRQGEAIHYIRSRFPKIEIVNAEVSKVMLNQAKKIFPKEVFIETDLKQLPYIDNYFDAILSLEMLEHSPYPYTTVCEMYRVLKNGGNLVLTCPSMISEFHLWVADKFFQNHGEGPHRFPSIFDVKKMLKYAGFKLNLHKSTLFIPEELGKIGKINFIFEKIFQWFPLNELGLRQLYVAQKLESNSKL